jgi:hypothetical protein
MVRQHLKRLLSYICEYKRDLLKVIQEMETTKISGTYTKQRPETCHLHDLHYDGGMQHQNNEGGGSLAETPSPEPALSTGSQTREMGQKWTGTSPLLFTIAASSISGASDMESVAGRVRRRLSSQGFQNPESEEDLPSAGIMRRRSLSSTRFSVIAGMPSGS